MEILDSNDYPMNYQDFLRRVVKKNKDDLYNSGFVILEHTKRYHPEIREGMDCPHFLKQSFTEDDDSVDTFILERDSNHRSYEEEVRLLVQAREDYAEVVSLIYDRQNSVIKVETTILDSRNKRSVRSQLEELLNVKVSLKSGWPDLRSNKYKKRGKNKKC